MKKIINTNLTLAIAYTKTFPLQIEIDTLEFDTWIGNDVVANADYVNDYIWENSLTTKIGEITTSIGAPVNYNILKVESDTKNVQDFLTASATDLKNCCKAALPTWTYCPTCGNKLKK